MSDDESTNDESEDLRKELSDIPLGEIQKLKETMGLKKYTEAVFGSYKQTNRLERVSSNEEKKFNCERIKKDRNKGETVEIEKKKKSEPEVLSSKIKKYKPRNVVELKRKKTRDPRFDDLSGVYDEKRFDKSYEFLNEIRNKEIESVKMQLKKEKDVGKKGELHKLLTRIKQQNKNKEAQIKRQEKEAARKKEEKQLVEKGKKPFYLKKSEKKKIELAEKYKELKSSGQLDKYLSKKRKRNATKEKKKLPTL